MIVEVGHIPLVAEETQAKPTESLLRPVEPVAAAKKSEFASDAVQSSRSRLAYDKDLARVFVEIVDPESGEVVDRFPPEELVRHMKNLTEQDHLPSGQDGTGLLLDRFV
ncbi:MAG: flagellar protein FlaG [Rhodospirillales bacterium]|nr:flagellar protein FlaG [Rhodospirillales bacterium]MDH3790372.1 flagellar protein FlaG [Rhodospirillales bacterium]MDH3910637.1 flagellar protein FlaG [Rhodospirillales bacterium]MDH3919009.1 flagellar protein FlaG [Rhodospirillales bacterium]MDH3965562.1 flagellar protein FlaG [Rhodospirillales bacterium]